MPVLTCFDPTAYLGRLAAARELAHTQSGAGIKPVIESGGVKVVAVDL